MAWWAMLFGVIGIVYGAMLAFAQTDIKRLIAYTSVSHMGFVLLGIFAFREIAMQGVVTANGYTWHKHRRFVCFGRNAERAIAYKGHQENGWTYGLPCPRWVELRCCL